MLKNNIELDVKTKCIESGITQVKLAREINTSASYVNRILKSKDSIVNKTFLNMMEALGYDVEIGYVKRSEEKLADGN